jgi:hypothetical protein
MGQKIRALLVPCWEERVDVMLLESNESLANALVRSSDVWRQSYESRYGHRVRLAVPEWGLK